MPHTCDVTDFKLMGHAAELGAPNWANGHCFGVDDLGRDPIARSAQGTGISRFVCVIGAFNSVVAGTIHGAVSGYIGGLTDQIMMRIVVILLAISFMFVLILMLVMCPRPRRFDLYQTLSAHRAQSAGHRGGQCHPYWCPK